MRFTRILRHGALMWLALCQLGVARADAELVLDEPKDAKQQGSPRLQMSEDGLARLRLKWSSASDAKHTVDFSLSLFKAADKQVAVVGFAGGSDEALLPYRRNVEVPAEGAELLLGASSMASDVDYSGVLSATIDKSQRLIWDLTLFRQSSVLPFLCPSGPQLVNQDGSVAVSLQRTALRNKEATLGLRLSAFTANTASGQELGQVGFLNGTSRELQRELAAVSSSGRLFSPAIRTAGLTEGATYSGKLWILAGAHEVMECSLELLVPSLPKGELVSDSASLNQSITLPLGFGDPDAVLALHLFEKTRKRRVDGITATVEGVTESPEGSFDLSRHVSFWVDEPEHGRRVDFTRLKLPIMDEKERVARTLQPGEQLGLKLRLHELHAGKYAFTLKWSGNTPTTDPPKVAVTLNVRHHWFWAVLAVLVALAVSFVITKGITNWRERLRVRSRIEQLKEERFEEHSELFLVVFLRAVLDLSAKLIEREWILPPPSSVYEHVACAERIITILRRHSAVSRALDDISLSSVRNHYRQRIGEVLDGIARPQSLDQQSTESIVEALTAIKASSADPMVSYFTSVKSRAAVLAAQARAVAGKLGEPAVVNALIERLEQAPDKAEQAFDDAYWLIKLLISRLAYAEDIPKLVEAYKVHQDLGETFVVGDALAWRRIVDKVGEERVSLMLLDGDKDSESLRPIRFALKFEDKALAESYIVRNVLEYTWHFTLVQAAKGRHPTAPISWSKTVNSPRLTQYIPCAGQLKVSVTIHFKSETCSLAPLTIDFAENTELSLNKYSDASDYILLSIIGAIALATGLPILYFSKPTFGSFADYAGILAWAIGIDQGKNLVQLWKSYTDQISSGRS